jgi:RNA polymerase sigma factor (sigma-70 family)
MLAPFQTFMDEYRNDVWRFLQASVGPAEAEDCFQETFLAALRAYPRLSHQRNLRSWVLTIAHRKAIDAHRGKKRNPRPTQELPDRPGRPTEERDPEVWSAVRSLPDRQRAAVVYRFVEDLAYREIAKAMECTEQAARQNVSEGIRKLREVFGT